MGRLQGVVHQFTAEQGLRLYIKHVDDHLEMIRRNQRLFAERGEVAGK